MDRSDAARFANGGAMGRLIASHDWTTSPLGPISAWPDALRNAVALILPAQAQIVLFWGPDHVAIYNDAYAPTIGDKHPRALGRPAREGWAELWDDLGALLDGVLWSGKTFLAKDREFYIERFGYGETVYFDTSFSVIPLDDGSAGGVLCLVSETTDRVRAMAAAHASEQRLQSVADSVDQMIWSTRADGFHDYYNRRWYDFTGAPVGTTDGEGWNDMFHPDDQDRAWATWRHSLDTGTPYHIEYRLRHRSGEYRWVLGRAQPVRDADGAIARWYGTCTDIHDLKAAEDALRDSRDALAADQGALEILNRTATHIAGELDLETLVQTVVDAGVELTGAQFGAFFYNVHNDGGEGYMLYALSGVDSRAFDGFPMPRKTAIFAPTFDGIGVVRSDDITQDPRYGHDAPHFGMPAGHLPVRSYLAVPVSSRSGEVVGGLFFGHERPGVFMHREERLVAGLAPQAAVGIDNARLFHAEQLLNQTLEAEVRARTQERDEIWQVSQDLLGVADAEGVWRSVNPAWTSVLGWSAAELVGRTTDWLLHPDDQAKTQAEIASLREGQLTTAFENRFRAKDGGYRVLSWRAVPVGRLLYTVARDVTEQRDQANALAEAEERLRQAQKMETVGQLTGGLAHDFNNLLQIVSGNLETLTRNLPADQVRLRRAATNAMSGAARAATLTQRLLAFSRRQPLQPRPIDPNRLVAGMSELLHRTIGETIAIETVLASGLWQIEADPNQLENAILNLAVNARDAMPEGGKLTIETGNAHLDRAYSAAHGEVTPGHYVMICVSDTGSGMDAGTIERAFEPFFTTKDVGKGTGLGLSMVYGFVKQSGGHVRIYSEAGEGTTVRIYLPRLIGGVIPEDVKSELQPPEGSQEEVILVCEDDDEVRAYSIEILHELGYCVHEAADGPAALRIVEQRDVRIDLLFTDVVLPGGMTGAVLAERARAIRPDLKILFTTGYARDAIVHHGRLDAGVELITKPFAFADLAARIRDMLDGVLPQKGV